MHISFATVHVTFDFLKKISLKLGSKTGRKKLKNPGKAWLSLIYAYLNVYLSE